MTAKLDSGQYVLVDSAGTVYQLDDQASAQRFTGKKVKVSGTVEGSSNSNHVNEIKEVVTPMTHLGTRSRDCVPLHEVL